MGTNPFSTRYFQPGAIRYDWESNEPFEQCLEQLFTGRDPLLIVGPHGSGKSTLVSTLWNECNDRGIPSRVVRLTSSEPNHWKLMRELIEWQKLQLVFVDGLEQIHPWLLVALRWIAVSLRVRLVGTSHQSIAGWRILWETRVDERSERAVLESLLREYPPRLVDEVLRSDAWRMSRMRHGSNLRESLFDMYDWWQTNEAHLP